MMFWAHHLEKSERLNLDVKIECRNRLNLCRDTFISLDKKRITMEYIDMLVRIKV